MSSPGELSQDEFIAMARELGLECTGCGATEDIVMFSLPPPGAPFLPEMMGEKAWCRQCALTLFAKPQGEA